MCVRVAPSAMRTPISRVRSVTVTSMMFMIPMPPTSRLTPAMPGEQKAEDLGRLLLRRQELLAIDDREVVVPPWRQPMHPPQDALDGDHRLRQLGPALHFHRDGLHAVVTGDAVPRCLDRNVDSSSGLPKPTAPFIA